MPEADNLAFVFPGQGSQFVGMGLELAQSEEVAAQLFEEADSILGFPLSQLCWHGPATELNATVNTQPALLTHSVAVLRVLQIRRPDLRPRWTAGHSVGEFAALVAAEALTYGDALRLVRERGQAMSEAGELHPGGMAAVLGLSPEAVEQVCADVRRETGLVLQVANDNCPGQVVVSGDEAALALAADRLKASGARKVIRLAVSIAAHSALMVAAQARFRRALDATSFSQPATPIIGNVSAAPLHSVDDIRAELSAQLISQVRWTESVRTLARLGATSVLELGSGSVLTGLVGRIDPNLYVVAVDAPRTLGQLPS